MHIVISRRRLTALIGAAAISAGRSTCADEAVYPNRPIHLVVPFAAGGGTDILARMLGDRLTAALKQPVVIENLAGANGAVANGTVARRSPDGYTIMLGSSSTQAIAPLLSKRPSQDLFKTFDPVSMVAYTPLVLCVNAASPVKDLRQFLSSSKSQPLSFGTYGIGSSPHILGLLLADGSGIALNHIPYKGSSAAVTDLLGGHVDSVFLTVAAVSQQLASGSLRALAISGVERSHTLPAVPTFKELGYPHVTESGWFAVFAPAGTPPAVCNVLAVEIRKMMAQPDAQAKFVQLGLDPVATTPKELAVIWRDTAEITGKVVRKAGITVE